MDPIRRRVRAVLLCDVRFIDSFPSSAYEPKLLMSTMYHVHQEGVFIFKLKLSKGRVLRIGGEPFFIPLVPMLILL